MAESKKIGARIVLDGEQEFRQSINNSKTALKALDSELKLTQTQFKNQGKSLESLKSIQQTYIKQQEALQKQEKTYVAQIESTSKVHDKAVNDYKELGKSVEDLKDKLEDAKKEYGENSDEVKDLTAELEKAESDYKKQGTAISNLENKQNRWQTELNNTRIQLSEVEANLKDTNDAIDHYDDALDDVDDSTTKASTGTEKFGLSLGKLVTADVVADAIKKVTSALIDMAQACIETGSEFEKSMSNVSALSGATGDELNVLSEKAQELGANTMFSASQAADAFSYMALAGWNTESMLEGIEPVLNLAAAADMDLAEASDIVTDYLTAFGLTAQDASKFTDQMAYAMANSNTDVEMLGEAYKNCAAAAGSMGYSVEDVTGALMTMANAGVKGGEAGTSLRSIMINLATNNKKCADTLHEYGVEIYDSQGNMRSLSDILVETSEVFKGLSDEESNSLAKLVAGKTQYTGFQTIMLGLSDAAKESGQSMTDYAAALEDCDGYAKQMADTMQDNLQGDITILESAMDGLKIASYECFDDGMRTSVQAASDAFSVLTDSVKHGDLGTSLKDLGKAFGDMAEDAALLSETELPALVEGLTWIIEHREGINTALDFASPATKSLKEAVSGIYDFVTGEGELERHAKSLTNEYSNTAAAYDEARDSLEGLTDAEKLEQEIALGQERLAELADERAKAENRLADAKERLAETNQYSWLGNETQEYADAKAAVDIYQDSLNSLNNSYSELEGQLSEYEAQQEYNNSVMASGAEGLTGVGDAANYTAGELAIMNEDFQESVADLQESIEQTLESSNSIFTSTKDIESQNISEMKKNIEDHVNQINSWKDSYTELSGRVNDETGAVLSYLANMGVEGKGYIDEMLKLDDSELNEFVEKMQEALTLPEDVSTEITASYTDSIKNSIDGMVGTVKEAAASGSELNDVQKQVAESLPKTLDENWGENGSKIKEKAEDAMDAIDIAVKDSKEPITQDTKAVAAAVNSEVSNGTQYSTYYHYGEHVGSGLADGISSKEDEVRSAVNRLTEAAKSTTTYTLRINSPSKVFRQYGDYVGEGFEIGIEESMKKAVATLNDTLPNDKNVELSSVRNIQVASNDVGNGMLSNMVSILSNYLPQLANMQVVLDTGSVAGAMAPSMNQALGKLNVRRT